MALETNLLPVKTKHGNFHMAINGDFVILEDLAINKDLMKYIVSWLEEKDFLTHATPRELGE